MLTEGFVVHVDLDSLEVLGLEHAAMGDCVSIEGRGVGWVSPTAVERGERTAASPRGSR